MQKYAFKIRTRTGMLLENLTVMARDRAEAEGKITQIYRHSEIVECKELASPNAGSAAKGDGFNFEDAITLISKSE